MSEEDSATDVDPLTIWRRHSLYCSSKLRQDARQAAFVALDRIIAESKSDQILAGAIGVGHRAYGSDEPTVAWADLLLQAKSGCQKSMFKLRMLAMKSADELDIFQESKCDDSWTSARDLVATLTWLALDIKSASRPPAAALVLTAEFCRVPHDMRDQLWHVCFDCLVLVQQNFAFAASASAYTIADQLGILPELEQEMSVRISQKIKKEWEMKKAEAGESNASDRKEAALLASAGAAWRDGKYRWTSAKEDQLPTELRKQFAVLCNRMPIKKWERADKLREALIVEFPWLGDAIDTICDDLELQQSVAGIATRIRPLVLLGAPGCGKSRLLNRLVSMHGGMSINMAGMTDNRLIAGTARGWSSQYPSAVSVAAARSGMVNPIMGLDELDKIGELDGRNGDPRQSLLTMLEQTTAQRWMDEGLGAEIDCSRVSWVATANDKSKIPALLRSRLRFVECPAPRAQDFDVLWAGCLGDIAAELCIERWALPDVDGVVVATAREGFQRGRLSARSLARVVRVALQEAGKAERAQPRN